MICHYCKEKIENKETYYDIFETIVCDNCISDFLYELKKDCKKVFMGDLERIDIATDSYRDERSLDSV